MNIEKQHHQISLSREIVFINQATGYLTIDVINEFAKVFEKVALIAGSIRIQNIQLNEKVNVTRIIRYNRGNNFNKAISWLLGTIQIFFLLKFSYRGYEKFFFTIPPTAYLQALSFRPPFSIVLFDLYPQAMKANGFNEKGIIYRWWSFKNRKIFPKANKIYTLSENMKSLTLECSPEVDVRVIPNWSAFSGLTPIDKNRNMIIQREGLAGKFIIQYSGNIGFTHNVETLVEVAYILKHHKDIIFQIIGRGERINEIRNLIHNKGLSNCVLLPFRRDEDLYESLCVADLAIIMLDDKTSDISVPSKTYNILAAGVPIMAIAPLTSGISNIILLHNTGNTFEKSNISGMSEYILKLKGDWSLWKRLSENSLKASENYTMRNATKYFEHYVH